MILTFFHSRALRGASKLLGGHEVLFSALHCEHVGNHLPGYGKRHPILVPSLSLPLINQSQLMAVSRSQFPCPTIRDAPSNISHIPADEPMLAD